jgi:hypothetical protein
MANARLAQDSQAALDASGRHLIAMGRDEHLLWWTLAGSLLSESCPDWDAMPGPRACGHAGIAPRARADESGATVRLELGIRRWKWCW